MTAPDPPAEARKRADRHGRSIRCGGWDEGFGTPGPPHQCQNDGSSCLCPCHDKEE